MTHILKNDLVEIHIDLPGGNYQLARFDWTGKITLVKFKNNEVSGVEKMDVENYNNYGKGFYNEFGIDAPVGFDETDDGAWFHKIGIGLLKKEGEQYVFSNNYEIRPAEFSVTAEADKLTIACTSDKINGYAYFLKKEIALLDSGFEIRYNLHNTGEKIISTNEYCHNFLAINKEYIGRDYILRFPFQIKPELFWATVNPEEKVEIGTNEITFSGTPEEQFFFANLSGNENVEAKWELINTKSKTGISEKGSFSPSKINLWGWKHVISPELFFDINLQPGQSVEWSRTYHVFELD
ncbi:MAG: hypothetical protein K9H16_12360 [Bacteroidales bacterium]|nr:hypothetical protein [Bacteroidales bacterium]